MPQLSAKSHAMPASPIRKLVPFAEKAKKRNRCSSFKYWST